MRATALLLLAFATAAFAADLKPGEQLPWCRVTLNMAATIDRDPPELRTSDGWYDAETHLLLPAAVAGKDAVAFVAPLDPARIVKVDKGAFSPQPMPARAVALANDARKHAAEKAPRDKPSVGR